MIITTQRRARSERRKGGAPSAEREAQGGGGKGGAKASEPTARREQQERNRAPLGDDRELPKHGAHRTRDTARATAKKQEREQAGRRARSATRRGRARVVDTGAGKRGRGGNGAKLH